jgi:hypothetical protein
VHLSAAGTVDIAMFAQGMHTSSYHSVDGCAGFLHAIIKSSTDIQGLMITDDNPCVMANPALGVRCFLNSNKHRIGRATCSSVYFPVWVIRHFFWGSTWVRVVALSMCITK